MKEEHGSPGRGKCGQKQGALKMQRAVRKPGVVGVTEIVTPKV